MTEDFDTPRNIEAERALIGAMLLDTEAAYIAIETLDQGDFYRDAHGVIFAAIKGIVTEGKAVDIVTLADALSSRGSLENCGGMAYLAGIMSAVPSAAGAREYAKIIKDKARRRELIRVTDRINALSHDESGDIEAIIKDAENELFRISQGKARPLPYSATSAAASIQDFIDGIAESVNTPYIPTGFTRLDDIIDGGLYEGLYIMGAITTLGKTSLILQIADNIAADGADILYISLEMARAELIAKSVSRHTLTITLESGGDIRHAKTARGITTGIKYQYYSDRERELIKAAVNAYRVYAGNVYIIEGVGDIGVDDIRRAVEKHILFTGKKPVVIVDYLQILAPYNDRATDKQNTDKAVLELKRISRDYKIPMIGISSFNRDHYSAEVKLAAFKESGAIEYGSDVLIGLQLAGAGESGLDVKAAMDKDPREIELVILKNRNGKAGDKIPLEYFKLFNYFREADSGEAPAPKKRR